MNVVCVMPIARARRVIIWANRSSLPPSSSPSAAAASFADLVTRPRIACWTVILLPGTRPSLVGSIAAAWADTGTSSLRLIRRSRSASNTRYRVISLARLAGWRGASALTCSSTAPLATSTTIEL